MLVSLTASSTSADATDLGYLLHKHPDRVRSVDVGFGQAHVFYPEASATRCTATLFVEVDPIALARGRKGRRPQGLEPYVNDRPYAASSMLSVAIGRLFGTALAGTCENRPELVDKLIDLEIELPVVPARGGAALVKRLFEPLGYEVSCVAIALDDQFPTWGDSPYLSVSLAGRHTVRRALEHLFVLLPVLDDKKHYWIGEDEIEKLLRRGGDWLPTHREGELIIRRYLRFSSLSREALSRLAESVDDSDAAAESQDRDEAEVEHTLSLGRQRLDAVMDAVRAAGAGRVVDLGCGEGRLLQRLVADPAVTEVLGVDVSISALERAERRLRLDEMSERRREQVRLVQGALTYLDDRWSGFDVATLIEVIEHLDRERLDVFAQVVFGHATPGAVIVSTPNREYNVNFEQLGIGEFRHRDHRFEWTRAEFGKWVDEISATYGYTATLSGIGPEDAVHGPPTQMVVFRR